MLGISKIGLFRSRLFLIILSFLIVAAAQPDWSLLASLLTAAVGYALFWKGVLAFPRWWSRFCLSLLWFGGIQTIQLSWFFADRYVGPYVYLLMLFLALWTGVQFALITLLIPNPKKLGLVSMLGISGGWALFEWSRLFFLSGFSWNPSGLALTHTLLGLQGVSLFGIFGLGFWVFFTNLCALKLLTHFTWSHLSVWGVVALLPYLFGFFHLTYQKNHEGTSKLNVLLVQTSIYPEWKVPLEGSAPLSPLYQWERILMMLYPHRNQPVDLVVLPEATVPYGTDLTIYPWEDVAALFETYFGGREFLPPHEGERVANSYWAQALANLFHADVAIGLEHPIYNAAYLFHPYSDGRDRYEKRVLVPMGEYIPFSWCKKILSKYGITDSFTRGTQAKVFATTTIPMGLTICYEETYGHMMRKNRAQGAELLINVTNDVWYPRSRLPFVHYLHGRLRAVEQGIPLVRSCNTGVTCAIDSFGRTVGILDYETKGRHSPAGALYQPLSLYTYPTLYARAGDWPVILFSALAFVLMVARGVIINRSPSIKELEATPLHKN